jgi:hypothetical protein
MPKNISDEEYQFLQGRHQIASFVESIYNDPKLSKEAKRLIKKKYPAMQIPDLDIEDRIDARLDEERKQREERESTERQEADQRSWKEQRASTQKKYGLTDEAMTDLEKMMVEKNVGDYDIAASYVAQKEPKAIEATFDNQRWEHEKQPGFADIAKDPEGWARNELIGAMGRDQQRLKGLG